MIEKDFGSVEDFKKEFVQKGVTLFGSGWVWLSMDGSGKLVITQEGAKKKFVQQVEQVTFSGKYANKVHQPVLYITERAVFELRPEGVTLIEIAPGIDLQTQVLDQMEFKPQIAEDLKVMDERIFREELMGLKEG